MIRRSDETDKPLNIKAYPNPATAAFNVSIKGGSNKKIKMLLLNADGKVIYNITGNSNKNYSFGQGLATGVYAVQVIQGSVIRTLKLIKIRG
jgi:hypothetical protein